MLLRLAPLGPDLQRNFKFSEMINAGQFRTDSIPAFSKVIEENASATLSVHIFHDDIERAKRRFQIANFAVDFNNIDNLYVIAVIHLVTWCANNFEQLSATLGTNQPIDFIFDNRAERKLLRDA